MRGAPVAHHVTFEAKVTLEVFHERVAVAARPVTDCARRAVLAYLIVGAHDGAQPSRYAAFERRVVDLVLSPLVDHGRLAC